MTSNVTAEHQRQFAASICRAIRESRRRQKLTQAELAARTGGLISKASLANYETGHRSLRIDVVWVIAVALGEDLETIVQRANRSIQSESGEEIDYEPALGIVLDLRALKRSDDPDLKRVVSWYKLLADEEGLMQREELSLKPKAVTALALYMRRTEHQLVQWLHEQQILVRD